MLKIRYITCYGLIFLFLCSTLAALKIDSPETSFNSFFNFYSNNKPSVTASGRGYTGAAANMDLSSSVINPAAMNLSRVWEIFYEYQSKDEIKISEGDQRVNFSSYRQTGTFGIGLKLDRIQTGIVYFQRSNYNFSTCIRCVYNEAVVDSMNYHLKATIHDFTIPICYQIHDNLRLGTSLILENYESADPAPLIGQNGIQEIITGKVDFNMIRFKLGFVADPTESISIGASVMPQNKRDLKKEFGLCYGCNEYSDNTFPTEITTGINYHPQSLPIKFLADYNYSNDSAYKELKDRHDLNLGIEIYAKKYLTLRTGFFTQHDYRNTDYKISGDTQYYWDDSVSYDQYFLTTGFTLMWKRLSINASLMDSSLISKGDIDQTYFTIGTSLNL